MLLQPKLSPRNTPPARSPVSVASSVGAMAVGGYWEMPPAVAAVPQSMFQECPLASFHLLQVDNICVRFVTVVHCRVGVGMVTANWVMALQQTATNPLTSLV